MNVNASRNCEQGNVGYTILTDFQFGLKIYYFFLLDHNNFYITILWQDEQ